MHRTPLVAGQLGGGTQTHRSSFVRVLDAGVSSVHSGGSSEYGFAVLNDGSLRSAGRNHYGQLGDGTQSDRSVFGLVLPAR